MASRIRLAVDSLLESAGGSDRVPSLHSIARNLGVASVRDMDMQTDGAVLRNNGRICIILNSRQSETRRRFTLAHEIAHLIFNKDLKVQDDERRHRGSKTSQNRRIEFVCDAIASELLMPTAILRADVSHYLKNNNWNGIRLIERIARDYKVSIKAAATAVAKRASQPISAAWWTLATENGAWTLTCKWAAPHAGVKTPIFPTVAADPRSSVWQAHRSDKSVLVLKTWQSPSGETSVWVESKRYDYHNHKSRGRDSYVLSAFGRV